MSCRRSTFADGRNDVDMTRTNAATILLVGLAGLGAACAPAPPPIESAITNGQGEMAGEVTTDSVILQSRLTTIDGWVDGDLRGVPGVARFEVARSADFTSIVETTDWIDATADRESPGACAREPSHAARKHSSENNGNEANTGLNR